MFFGRGIPLDMLFTLQIYLKSGKVDSPIGDSLICFAALSICLYIYLSAVSKFLDNFQFPYKYYEKFDVLIHSVVSS